MAQPRKQLFRWRGLSADGLPRAGWRIADDAERLSQQLSLGGITLLKARRHPGGNCLKTDQAYRFLEQLTALLNAGTPILDALKLVNHNPASRRTEAILSGIADGVESGQALSDSIAPFLKRSDQTIIPILSLGERSGKFDEILNRLITQHKKAVRVRAQLTRAAMYPAVLTVVSTAVVVLMMVWIVPEFGAIYADFDATLPAYTLAIVSLSDLVVSHGLSAALWCIAAVAVFMALRQIHPRLQYALARIQLQLPVAGHLLKIRLYRQFAADMNLIYRAGMPLAEALSWLPSTSAQLCYRAALRHLRENVNRGVSLSKALDETRFFSPFIVQTVRVGENSGSLEQAFERVERMYDETLNETIDKVIGLFEPLLVAMLSLIIGALVVALYLPMFNLGFAL